MIFNQVYINNRSNISILVHTERPAKWCTYQYGVPMKESLLCIVLVFLADTPKSAVN